MNFFEEGRRYLDALKSLGLRPAACFWAYDRPIEAFTLVLITDEYDYAGPLALSRLLFRAYNADATPKAIDPLIIRLHSTQHQVVREMDVVMPFYFTPDDPTASSGIRAITTVGGLEIDGDWVYRFNKPLTHRQPVEVRRNWRRFEKNVERAAA